MSTIFYADETIFSVRVTNLENTPEVPDDFENMHKLFQLSLVLLYDRCSQNTEKKIVENNLRILTKYLKVK